MTKTELTAYLKDVAALEQDLYTLNETETALKAQKQIPEYHEFSEPVFREVSDADIGSATESNAGGFFLWSITLSLGLLIPLVHWWTLLLGIPCCLFLFFIFTKLDRALTKKRLTRERVAEYDAALAQYEQDAAEESDRYAQDKAYCERFNTRLAQQLAAVRSQKEKTMDALQLLYGRNIIYPKYRTIVPVTMFCEYMESGRCEALDGADGAYNKYEDELHMDLILDTLSSIKSVLGRISSQIGSISGQLKKIQQNQYLLYQELQEGNRIAADIANTAVHIAQSNAAITANTAWTAYSAAAAARSANVVVRAFDL